MKLILKCRAENCAIIAAYRIFQKIYKLDYLLEDIIDFHAEERNLCALVDQSFMYDRQLMHR